MELENTGSAVQERVVDSPDPSGVTSGVEPAAEGDPTGSQPEGQEGSQDGKATEPEPGAAAKPQQSLEDNARFAEARRRAEAEMMQMKAQNDRLLQALNSFGYAGSPEEISDALMAQSMNTTVEEARKLRETKEREEAERLKLQSETEYYKKIAIEKLMADDLAAIQKVYPEVKSLQELGQEFFGILQTGQVSPVTAYEIIKAQQARDKKPIPPEIGAVNEASAKEKDYYTPEEVDRLSKKDLDNPKIMERVLSSMSNWKRR